MPPSPFSHWKIRSKCFRIWLSTPLNFSASDSPFPRDSGSSPAWSVPAPSPKPASCTVSDLVVGFAWSGPAVPASPALGRARLSRWHFLSLSASFPFFGAPLQASDKCGWVILRFLCLGVKSGFDFQQADFLHALAFHWPAICSCFYCRYRPQESEFWPLCCSVSPETV